jgi:nucleoside-diphosphate-sugar epimerase
VTYTFVAGGTGFVGREFVEVAASTDVELCVLTRDPVIGERLGARGIRTVTGDLRAPGPWTEAAAGADRAVYVAGPPTWGRRLSRRVAAAYREGMTEMTRAFLDHLNPDRVQSVVYVAGASYYGDTGDAPASEDQEPHPKGTGPYIAPAVELAEASTQRGIPTMVAFPGAVYGPGSWLAQLVLEPLHRRKPIYALRGHEPAISLIHREDCARAILHLLSHGTAGHRYFLADDEPMTLQSILDLSSSLTGIPYRKRPLPKWLCRIAIGPILTEAATGNVVVSNAKLTGSGFELRYPSMQEGLAGVIDEWRSNASPGTATGPASANRTP